MFNIFVVLSGLDMVTDPTRATTCRRKFKARKLQTKMTKNEGPSENMGFNVKTVWWFQTKKKQNKLLAQPNNPVEHTAPKNNNWKWPLYSVSVKLNKTWKKDFRSKLLEICKTRAMKSSPDVFNFYVVLAGHDMVTDATRATTCRRKFKATQLQTKMTKNEGPSENLGFIVKTVW